LALRQQLPHDASQILGLVPRELQGLIDVPNTGAHAEGVSAETLGPLRELVLGVGREGMVARLVRAGMRGK
jgi:hypothetical protein